MKYSIISDCGEQSRNEASGRVEDLKHESDEALISGTGIGGGL